MAAWSPRSWVASFEASRSSSAGSPLFPSPDSQVADQVGQGPAVDELHGVIMHAPVTADGVHGNDVRMVQERSGLGLELEPAEPLAVKCQALGQDLQGHAAAE